MYIKKLLQQRTILSALTFLIAGVILISSSYALFTKSVSDTSNQTLALGDLSIEFSKGSTISITDLDPMSELSALDRTDNLYSFTVTNLGDVSYEYSISLVDNEDYLENGSSYSSEISLLSHDFIKCKLNNSDSFTLSSLEDNKLYNSVMDAGEHETFSFRLWMPEGELPNSVLGSEIHLKIVINGKASPTKEELLAESNNDEASDMIPNTTIFDYDYTKPNAPVLSDNMIPVIYDEVNDVWIKSGTRQTEWYNYSAQIWANAVTVTESTRDKYNTASVGEPIPMSDIVGMWVWIPRFEYKITNVGSTLTTEEVKIKFVSGISTVNTSGYFIHPSFRNGETIYQLPNGQMTTAYSQGGWDAEQQGFWYGKFETGMVDNIIKNTTLTEDVLVKPDMDSIRYLSLVNQWNTTRNVHGMHGFGDNADLHLTKNDEWGAVAYLSLSLVGKFGNSSYAGANKEVYSNNGYYLYNSYYFMSAGRSSGTYPGNPDSTNDAPVSVGTYEYNNCPASLFEKVPCEYSVRQANANLGTGASTTGTIYGVYDMSGGASELMMAWFTGANSNYASNPDSYFGYASNTNSAGFTAKLDDKYWNKINNGVNLTSVPALATACSGNPCYGVGWSNETGNGNNSGTYLWFGDYINMSEASYPWTSRGDVVVNVANAASGILNSDASNGASLTVQGFRIVVSINES